MRHNTVPRGAYALESSGSTCTPRLAEARRASALCGRCSDRPRAFGSLSTARPVQPCVAQQLWSAVVVCALAAAAWSELGIGDGVSADSGRAACVARRATPTPAMHLLWPTLPPRDVGREAQRPARGSPSNFCLCVHARLRPRARCRCRPRLTTGPASPCLRRPGAYARDVGVCDGAKGAPEGAPS